MVLPLESKLCGTMFGLEEIISVKGARLVRRVPYSTRDMEMPEATNLDVQDATCLLTLCTQDDCFWVARILDQILIPPNGRMPRIRWCGFLF